MDDRPNAEKHRLRLRFIVWFFGACLTAVLIAIFIFNIPVKTAATYGFLILIFGAKLLLYPAVHDDNQEDTTEHIRYIGGCH
jgi:hypothetical protein